MGELERFGDGFFLEHRGFAEDSAVGGDEAALAVGAGEVVVGGGVGVDDVDGVFRGAGLDLGPVWVELVLLAEARLVGDVEDERAAPARTGRRTNSG